MLRSTIAIRPSTGRAYAFSEGSRRIQTGVQARRRPPLLWQGVVADRPRLDDEHVALGHAALPEGGPEGWIRLDRLLALDELVNRDRRLNAGNETPRSHLARRHRHDGLVRRPAGWVEDDGERLKVDGGTPDEAPHNLLRGLVEDDRHEADVWAEAALRPHESDGCPDLLGRKWVERMLGLRHRPSSTSPLTQASW